MGLGSLKSELRFCNSLFCYSFLINLFVFCKPIDVFNFYCRFKYSLYFIHCRTIYSR
nr:MAG TPA: hypothetical protein [Caudoviricetes sp.]